MAAQKTRSSSPRRTRTGTKSRRTTISKAHTEIRHKPARKPKSRKRAVAIGLDRAGHAPRKAARKSSAKKK